MSIQSEAKLEKKLIEQLVSQAYEPIQIRNESDLCWFFISSQVVEGMFLTNSNDLRRGSLRCSERAKDGTRERN